MVEINILKMTDFQGEKKKKKMTILPNVFPLLENCEEKFNKKCHLSSQNQKCLQKHPHA